MIEPTPRANGYLSRSRRIATAIALAGSFASVASPSAAQPGEPLASAMGRFDAAQTLFDQGKHADALALFQSVLDETRSPNARLMAARCLVALGRIAEGYDELQATVRDAAARAETEPKYARTKDAAAAELDPLEAKIGKIVIILVEPDATVSLDGKKLAADRLGVPIPVVPGKLAIVATRSDGTSVRRGETVRGGETKTIPLAFPGTPGPLPVKPAAPRGADTAAPEAGTGASPGPAGTGGGVRVAGFVIAGLGAVGMGIFGGTYAAAQSRYDALKTACGGSRCTDPQYADVVDAGKRMELVSNVSLVAGVVALGAGAATIIFGGPSMKPSSRTGAWSTTSVALSPYGAQIRYDAAF